MTITVKKAQNGKTIFYIDGKRKKVADVKNLVLSVLDGEQNEKIVADVTVAGWFIFANHYGKVDKIEWFDGEVQNKVKPIITGEGVLQRLTFEPMQESIETPETQTAAEIENSGGQNFTISLPKKIFTETAINNFKAILASKANLIKSAIGIDNVDFEVSENKLKFDWLRNTPSADEFQAYSDFICKVGELAKKQKLVTAKEREVENERYAFRCFLLRIGMIGEEFKTSRKILLEKLAGNCAFRSGHRRMETLKTA